MKFYRYVTGCVVYSEEVVVYPEVYHLLKETKCGYWICVYPPIGGRVEEDMKNKYVWKKWVSKDSRRRYAYPTKKEALESFLIRKHMQIGHAERDLEFARSAIRKAEQIEKELENDPE